MHERPEQASKKTMYHDASEEPPLTTSDKNKDEEEPRVFLFDEELRTTQKRKSHTTKAHVL